VASVWSSKNLQLGRLLGSYIGRGNRRGAGGLPSTEDHVEMR
jgi:hypothetical protein